jgi:SAM-dependent methyltransferase
LDEGARALPDRKGARPEDLAFPPGGHLSKAPIWTNSIAKAVTDPKKTWLASRFALQPQSPAESPASLTLNFEVFSMKKTPEQAMNTNAQALQESAQYYRWNLSLFPIERHKKILDVGCGPGHYFNEIATYKPDIYMGADYSANFLEQTKILLAGFPNYTTCQMDLLDETIPEIVANQTFDYVFCFDVIEHIENDKRALQNIRKIMMATGAKYLFLRVPALQWIYGENDKAIGHFRRYSAKALSTRMQQTGFQVQKLHYQNFFGVFFWYFVGKVAMRKHAVSKTEGQFINLVTPLLRFVEVIPPPIGLSVYCVCTVNSNFSGSEEPKE